MSERAARVDSGDLMGKDQGADGAGSGGELYQEQLRAQEAWFERSKSSANRSISESTRWFQRERKVWSGPLKTLRSFFYLKGVKCNISPY